MRRSINREFPDGIIHSRPTVLCVDDFKPGLLTRKVFLEQFGFNVLIASSGPEAIELIKFQKIDAIVMDYRMPGMDGEELAARIRKISEDVPLLLLSGFAREIPDRLRKTVSCYLTKGDAPGLLVSALNELTATSTEQRRTQKKNVVSINDAASRSKRKSV